MINSIKRILLFFDLVVNYGISPFTVIKNNKPFWEYYQRDYKNK